MSPGRRAPQLNLRLDAGTPDPAARWHEGASLAYLGGSLRLTLGSMEAEARRDGDTLALPLPPQATPRQIQDRAEAWLREEVTRLLQEVIAQKLCEAVSRGTALAGRRAPRLTLSFAARGNWVEPRDGDCLRCNWRLIEQPRPVIEQAIAHAIAALPREERGLDLFGASPASPAT